MKDEIARLLAEALEVLRGDVLPDEPLAQAPAVTRARDERHGNLASNVALTLARQAKMPPRELADRIVAALPSSPHIARVEIAGPGFINFHLSGAAVHQVVRDVLEQRERFGHSDTGAGRKVVVEFVSANPTGPLHVGHGRHAAYGATVAALLQAVGYDVHTEYYVNDAGRQIDILATSVWLRCLEAHGEQIAFPGSGYRGAYIRAIADGLVEREGTRLCRPAGRIFESLPDDAPAGDGDAHIDALIARAREELGDDFALVRTVALDAILADIRDDLEAFGVHHDRWFSERSLQTDERIEHTLDLLREGGHVYERDGALWLRATEFGDDKDRVLVRENGQTTYITPDIAYHVDKCERGYEILLDVLGADHHGYVARVRAGLAAAGQAADALEVRLIQFVSLFRGGEKVQMSTRSGEFVTLRELREEVGNDAARFYYVMRSNEQHLDFDLDLARTESSDNPVYYIQYAHARVCSVFAELRRSGGTWSAGDEIGHLDRLGESHEEALLRSLARFPEAVAAAAARRAPQLLIHYLRNLANDFHTWYNAHRFLDDDPGLRAARLALAAATRQVIANGLHLIGVSAPESMRSD